MIEECTTYICALQSAALAQRLPVRNTGFRNRAVQACAATRCWEAAQGLKT